MAYARRIKKKVREYREVERIQLELTEGEADFLQAVLAKIGGDPVDSPRKYQPRISEALVSATGQEFDKTDAHGMMNGTMHGIFFTDYPADFKPGDGEK